RAARPLPRLSFRKQQPQTPTHTMKAWIQTAIIAATFFAAPSGIFADEAKPGDKVAAKWNDGGHYLATVTAANGGQFDVLYDDGDKATVGAADLIRVRRDANFAVGDHV